MYQQGTILKLKEPRDPIVTDDGEEVPFPYNEVEVLGQSPLAHIRGQWEGADAQGVIISPRTSFDSNLDEPFGKVREMYEVVRVPETVIAAPTVRIINATTAEAGPTPEEVFQAEAPGVAPEPGQKRGRTSPLGDPGGPKSAESPLSAPRRRRAS